MDRLPQELPAIVYEAYEIDKTPVWIFDFLNHRMLWANDSALDFWGAKTPEEFFSRDFSSDSKAVKERLWQTVNAIRSGEWARDSWTLFPFDQPVTVLLDAKLVKHSSSDAAILFRMIRELDFAKTDPEGLRMMLTARTTPVAVSMFSLNGELISENPAALSLRHKHLDWAQAATHLASRYGSKERANEIAIATTNDDVVTFEFRLPIQDTFSVFAVTTKRIRDPVTGDVVVQITEEDITEKTKLAESLSDLNNELESRVEKRSRELAEANERLRHAQKLEAIGKLTGGIAHDFNNLLAVVQGNAELLREDFDDELVEEIRTACKRGAELTHQLLAYARKQSLRSDAVDLRTRLQSIELILKRTLGAQISLEIICPTDLWLAYADPGQIEDAILNLAINSRDAMPDGGSLTVHLKNCILDRLIDDHNIKRLSGDFVVISVADTGIGMSPEVFSKAIDPFFTTKPVGQGSGLGLSTIFGFARQSGGDLSICSELGKGTLVNLYLPRFVGPKTVGEKISGNGMTPRGKYEHILVVEDEPAVLRVVERILRTLGYEVTSFPEARSALEFLRNERTVDILLTDINLPDGMLGTDLARIVQKEFPEINFIFLSGLPPESIEDKHLENMSIQFLKKPVGREALANAIRAALNS